MDFSTHPLNRSSIIDRTNVATISIIDSKTTKLRNLFKDETLNSGIVALGLKHLGEAKVDEIADYISRKANQNQGHAFAKLCKNLVVAKGVVVK